MWVTGQIGRDPVTQTFVDGGFEAEFHQAITNLEQILLESGSSLDRVVRTEVQFVDEDDLDAMNRIYGERFAEPYPARSSYGVAFLWKGARVQISAVAEAARLSGAGRLAGARRRGPVQTEREQPRALRRGPRSSIRSAFSTRFMTNVSDGHQGQVEAHRGGVELERAGSSGWPAVGSRASAPARR